MENQTHNFFTPQNKSKNKNKNKNKKNERRDQMQDNNNIAADARTARSLANEKADDHHHHESSDDLDDLGETPCGSAPQKKEVTEMEKRFFF